MKLPGVREASPIVILGRCRLPKIYQRLSCSASLLLHCKLSMIMPDICDRHVRWCHAAWRQRSQFRVNSHCKARRACKKASYSQSAAWLLHTASVHDNPHLLFVGAAAMAASQTNESKHFMRFVIHNRMCRACFSFRLL